VSLTDHPSVPRTHSESAQPPGNVVGVMRSWAEASVTRAPQNAHLDEGQKTQEKDES
jgi:hypothetical protein